MQKPVEKPIKFVKNLSTKGKSYPITHVSAVIDDNGESVKSTIDSLKNKASLTKVTWLELKDKRDAGKLIPGSLYRITDYNCTTTQENTQSAGHQFDIVLLALSEDKLAEEGWAMEHPTDVYDVTFSDNVILKCYMYDCGDDSYNIVAVDSKLGMGGIDPAQIIFDEANKTASVVEWYSSTKMIEENLLYNYFQNSNLSAWKVWYSLDNDKSRFAWADDSVDATIVGINEYTRYPEGDTVGTYKCWATTPMNRVFTEIEDVKIGDTIYVFNKGNMVPSAVVETIQTEGTGLPNGRGVIYRLIDEWNNDVGYDFKNIQLYLPIVNGEYVKDGQKIWVYTFCLYNSDEGTYEDGSLKRIEASVDTIYAIFYNNVIVSYLEINRYFSIPFNLLLGYYSIQDEEAFSPSNCEFFNCTDAIVQNISNAYLYRCRMIDYVVEVRGIYYANKKVLTEE